MDSKLPLSSPTQSSVLVMQEQKWAKLIILMMTSGIKTRMMQSLLGLVFGNSSMILLTISMVILLIQRSITSDQSVTFTVYQSVLTLPVDSHGVSIPANTHSKTPSRLIKDSWKSSVNMAVWTLGLSTLKPMTHQPWRSTSYLTILRLYKTPRLPSITESMMKTSATTSIIRYGLIIVLLHTTIILMVCQQKGHWILLGILWMPRTPGTQNPRILWLIKNMV